MATTIFFNKFDFATFLQFVVCCRVCSAVLYRVYVVKTDKQIENFYLFSVKINNWDYLPLNHEWNNRLFQKYPNTHGKLPKFVTYAIQMP